MSRNKITYLDQFIEHGLFVISNPKIEILFDYKNLDIKRFLNTLEKNRAYVLSIEYVYS
jgi:hypothetical protein